MCLDVLGGADLRHPPMADDGFSLINEPILPLNLR
jgi:hypothetical protein